MVHKTFVALGSNTGARRHWLQFAFDGLKEIAVSCQASPVYRSRAHPLTEANTQRDYLNAVIELLTDSSPGELLRCCMELERQAGRVRLQRNAPRTLDLDILDHSGHTGDSPGLNVPHPRLHLRRFVLQPWCDLAPEHYIKATHKTTVARLLQVCPDEGLLVRCPWMLE